MQIIFSPAEEILSTTGHSSPVLSGGDQEYCDILSPAGAAEPLKTESLLDQVLANVLAMTYPLCTQSTPRLWWMPPTLLMAFSVSCPLGLG